MTLAMRIYSFHLFTYYMPMELRCYHYEKTIACVPIENAIEQQKLLS